MLDNGQVERTNRTIKDATVRRFHYDAHDQFRSYLADFVQAYDFARRLKTPRGLTPYEFICKAGQTQPERFILNPLHQMPGPNTRAEAGITGSPRTRCRGERRRCIRRSRTDARLRP